MKLNNLTKSVLAASALTVASFGANASVIAEASIDVNNLLIEIVDGQDNPIQFGLVTPQISFVGTSVSTVLNSNGDSSSFDSLVVDPFLPLAIDLDSNQTNGTSSSDANADISGNIFTPGGATGNTASTTSAYGTDTSDSGAQIFNDLKATFDFGVADDATAYISFGWVFNTLVSVFDQGGEGNADWKLNISLNRISGCTGLGGCPTLFNFDLGETLGDILGTGGNSVDSTGTLNMVGDIVDFDDSELVESSAIALEGGQRYQLVIDQATNASAVSVPEPTSVAILGLGLLGLAGAARRRKS